jgi:hypothetical protein
VMSGSSVSGGKRGGEGGDTIVGGANTTRSNDEIVSLYHPSARLDSRNRHGDITCGGGRCSEKGVTHISCSSSGTTCIRFLDH